MKQLFPPIKKRIDHHGSFHIFSPLTAIIPANLSKLRLPLEEIMTVTLVNSAPANLIFASKPDLRPEEYHLSIDTDGIKIDYNDYASAFYAVMTLKQLYDSNLNTFPCIKIEDWPDLSIRGFLMDISRDKIPTVSTIKAIIDKMATVKMNHLELYVEGFAYAYPSFPDFNAKETPLTLADYLEIEDYANQRAIDFSGNMNSFGHMTKWLELPRFRHLAECPHGFKQWGYRFPASTLNPLNPESEQLVAKMYQDMLPHLQSKYFNINCDEPFELGKGKSKKAVRKDGIGKIYVDFISKLVSFVNQNGKTAMVWGDVLIHHPEVLSQLPSGMIFLDWGYDRDYPFDKHMKLLADMKVNFIGCPGTSSWNSFASRKVDMMETTKNAADSVKKYGGMGLITTDWGDFGHLQYLPFSYPGLIYAGLVSWADSDLADNLVEPILSSWIDNHEMAEAILDLSEYSQYENKYIYNGTLTFSTIMFSDPSPKHPLFIKRFILQKALHRNQLTHASGEKIQWLLKDVTSRMLNLRIENVEQQLVYDEIIQTINNITIAVNVNLVINHDSQSDCHMLGNSIITNLGSVMNEHRRLWNLRNKPGGLTRSLSRLITLKAIIDSLRYIKP